MSKKFLLITAALMMSFGQLFAQDAHKEQKGEFNASEAILHHILDSHAWQITEIPDGHGGYKSIELDLPWILYSSRDGLVFYSSTEAMNHAGKYHASHGSVYAVAAEGHTQTPPAHTPEGHDAHKADTVNHSQTTPAHVEEGHAEGGHAEVAKDESVSVWDFSLTKTSFQMILVGLALLLLFTSIAKAYTKNKGKAPSGAQSIFEPIIMFVRDLAKEYLGKNYERFLPYLLTLFFFIWFSNLFGLTPLNSNIAGNIAVTCALAVLTLVLIVANGTKDFWVHILMPPGAPLGVQQLLTVIELLSNLIIKPVALAIRLFANIAAGHFMVLSLISLIFILGKTGESVGGAVGGAAIGVPFAIVIFSLEMLVAIVQAYIFTLLTTVFISMALESHDHDHHDDHHNALDSEVNKDLQLSDFSVH